MGCITKKEYAFREYKRGDLEQTFCCSFRVCFSMRSCFELIVFFFSTSEWVINKISVLVTWWVGRSVGWLVCSPVANDKYVLSWSWKRTAQIMDHDKQRKLQQTKHANLCHETTERWQRNRFSHVLLSDAITNRHFDHH